MVRFLSLWVADSGWAAVAAAGDAGINLLGEPARLEVADALQALAGDVAIEAPKLRLVVGNLLAVFPGAIIEFPDPVDLVGVEAVDHGDLVGFRRVFRHGESPFSL